MGVALVGLGRAVGVEVGGLGEAELWIVGGPDEIIVLVDVVVIPGGFVAREVESEAKIFRRRRR